jgi:asparagine synthase (glutamine-hydrolysing)
MTAICGLVSLDGAAIPRRDLELMCQALAHHGPGGVQVLQASLETEIAGASFPKPHLPGSSHLTSRNGSAIVLNARLDNRSELFDRLEIARPAKDEYADGDLILAAYEKWGERCAELLLGDFAFGIWDEPRRRLVCSRDHMGLRPLFYYADARRFIFASEPKAIVAVPTVIRQVNLDKLATLAFPAARPLFSDQSWFDSVFALPAATSLTLDQHGIRQHKYWEPQAAITYPHKSDRKILESFHDLMFEVVTARLRGNGPVVALLSGGLDSSAIVGVAARVLEARNQELHALAAVLPNAQDPQLTDERYFIDQFRDWPNVRIKYVSAPGRGPFDHLEELVWNCDAPNITSRHYLYSAFAECSQDLGARIILDGSGGELGPTFHGEGYYPELLLGFRWRTLFREMRLRKRVSGNPLWRSFKSDVAYPLLPTILLDRFRPRPKEDLEFELQQPLQLRFAERQLAHILSRVKVSSRAAARVLPNHARVQLQRLCTVQQKSFSPGFIGQAQVNFRYPFMDKRLLEFCLSAPGRLKVRNGYERYLIRAGLDELLPSEIKCRVDKKPFSPDYLRRYNAQRRRVQEILEDIRPHDPVHEIVDVEKIKALAALPVADNERGTFAESVALSAVPIGVYLIYFLRRFSEFHN